MLYRPGQPDAIYRPGVNPALPGRCCLDRSHDRQSACSEPGWKGSYSLASTTELSVPNSLARVSAALGS